MGEHAKDQTSPAMERLLDVLNADFSNDVSLPAFLQEGQNQAQGLRLQNRLMHVLSPILLTDPDLRRERRKATITALLRHAEKRQRPAEEIDGLRAKLKRVDKEDEEQLEREREGGLRELVFMLSEWAASARISPQWQVDEFSEEDAGTTRSDRYKIGKKSLAIWQFHPVPSGPWAPTMMCLGACLVSGELNRLRCCAECWKYFFARDFRHTCCGESCYKKRDGRRAVARMKRFRRKNQRALKTHFMAKFPKLGLSQIRNCCQNGTITDGEMEALERLRDKAQKGISLVRIWASATPRIRGIFGRLPMALG